MAKITVLTGSTRPGRFNIQVAEWVYAQANKQAQGDDITLVDIAELDLPLLDEANAPMLGQYEKSYTKKWAKIVDETDGFIVVTPEYNHSVPAALKNAFDYLYAEWNYKPIAFVSYGSAAGGSRAVEHLRGIAGELKMYDIREQILLPNYWEHLSEVGAYQFTEEQEMQVSALLDQLRFWSSQMAESRKALHAHTKK